MKGAQKFCNPNAFYNFGAESEVWFYDGARVYFQIADYTGDSSWTACALNIASQYRNWVIRAGGQIPSWLVFTQGMRMAYERTGDASYRTAIQLLATYGYVRWQTSVDDRLIRETSFALNALIDAERTGEPRSPHLYRLADYLLGHYDRLFVAKTYSIHQTFYDGLAAEALIDYYELTKDPRIPEAIKVMLDWMWDYGWDKGNHRLIYNPDPPGPTCSAKTGGCQTYNNAVINMVVPAFAWYWRVTGNSLYQQRGDEMFQHAFDADLTYFGKTFSQNFRWSFNYLRWRPGTCTYDVSWPAHTLPSAGGETTLKVTTQPNCVWIPTSNAAWAAIDNTLRHGPGATTLATQPNSTGTPRSAVITIADQSHSVTQEANNSYGLAALAISPATVHAGTTLTGTVLLKGTSTAPTVIQLASSNTEVASVPASVTVSAGTISATFAVLTKTISQATSVMITATFADVSKTVSVNVQPSNTALPKVNYFWLYPSTVKGGTTTTNNRVTLDQPAGPNGVTVSLASSDPAVLTVPAQITIPAGQTHASFPIVSNSVASTTMVSVTASTGSSSKTATLTIHPVSVLRVEAVKSIVGGKTAPYSRVGFDGPVPPAGAAVSLTSSNPAVAAVPPSVNATAPGLYSGHFPIVTTQVSTPTPVTISATYCGNTVTATIMVQPATVLSAAVEQTAAVLD
jgi:hypothetical protein